MGFGVVLPLVVLFAVVGFGEEVALVAGLAVVEFAFGIEVIFPGFVFSDSPAGVVAFALFPIEIIAK